MVLTGALKPQLMYLVNVSAKELIALAAILTSGSLGSKMFAHYSSGTSFTYCRNC